MVDKYALWEEITAKYKLKRVSYTDLVAWPFADYVFGADWDVMSDVTKSRLYGFHDVVGSEAMFVRLLVAFVKSESCHSANARPRFSFRINRGACSD